MTGQATIEATKTALLGSWVDEPLYIFATQDVDNPDVYHAVGSKTYTIDELEQLAIEGARVCRLVYVEDEHNLPGERVALLIPESTERHTLGRFFSESVRDFVEPSRSH